MEQSKIDNQFIRFINELQHSLQNDEDLTVILADTFSAPVEAAAAALEQATVEKEEKTAGDAAVEPDPGPTKPERPTTPPAAMECMRPSRFACFSGGVFGDDEADSHPNRLRFSFSHDLLRSSEDAADPEASQLFPVVHPPSPRAMRAGAQAWRELQSTPTMMNNSDASGGHINFRTGMSGHMALLSTHAHPHGLLTPARAGRMSAHTGLTMPRLGTGWQSILNSFTLPYTGSTNSNERIDPPIPPSGSM